MKLQFPENFVWGVATAAAQIEGGAFEDGRGPSIWDVFSRLPGKIKNGGIPDVCCDSYHHIDRDVAMLKELGVTAYRMSFSWSRILLEGMGEVNPAGLAYYRRLIDALKAAGIQINATIYHWDLPYALQVKGGFGNREVLSWYLHYARILFENFGEAVKLFRSLHLRSQIGIVVDVWKHYPARENNEIQGYGMFLHPLF